MNRVVSTIDIAKMMADHLSKELDAITLKVIEPTREDLIREIARIAQWQESRMRNRRLWKLQQELGRMADA